jgi:hypothetical protein
MTRRQPIIIAGMAHTGTTALAAYLGSARGWRNYVSGPEAYLLECDELLHRQAEPLREQLREAPRLQWVLKRPWLEEAWEWCLDEFPDACYLVMTRPFVDTWTSWNKPHSAGLSRGLVNATPEHAWEVWSRYQRWGSCLVAHARAAAWIDHSAFCRRPSLVDETLRDLGWRPGKFRPETVRLTAG